MTPSLFDLPVRTAEATALADLVLQIAGSAPLTDEIRNRIAARARTLDLSTTKPYFASLERDPIHPSAIYLAVDAIESRPLLLRLAPAATPSSGLFPKSILIGRVRGPKGMEVVMNAIPFSVSDTEAVKTFASEVNPAFLPRPIGNRAALIVSTSDPEAAFGAFRQILKTRGLNLAGIADSPSGMWGAIRSGWREGFVTGKEGARAVFLETDSPEEMISAAASISL